MLHPGESLDGYELVRKIGEGGFGEVWLCKSQTLGSYRALKFLHASGSGHLEKEFDALCRYHRAARKLHSRFIMPIDHVNRRDDGLFYIMPLADGVTGSDPEHPEWQPLTLGLSIIRQKRSSSWYSGEEILQCFTPLLDALQLISDAGLAHRDVKPDNVLFMNGSPCLADISLLGDFSSQLSRLGTPGHSAPSWFTESGGHPDMWGAASTLFCMLTGNNGDKMGRERFRWPPAGEESLSPQTREVWLLIHQAILRAIEEDPTARFTTFTEFSTSLRQIIKPPVQLPLNTGDTGNVNEAAIFRALEWAYQKAVNGVPGFDSAQAMAEEYLKNIKSQDELVASANSLIRWHVGKAGTEGFLTALGGMLSASPSVPSNVAALLYMQIRMAAALAHMAGFDLKNEQIKSLVFACLSGNSVKDVLKDTGIATGAKITKDVLAKLPDKTLTNIAQLVGSRMAGMSLGKRLRGMVPMLGAFIGAAPGCTATKLIGNTARELFIGKQSRPNAME
jgi:serine/threonine protein kinase